MQKSRLQRPEKESKKPKKALKVDFTVPASQIDGNDKNFNYKYEKIHSKTLNAFVSEQNFQTEPQLSLSIYNCFG